jgi:MoaA/NifB/PqqE/SkfB family radical SAM enzyme
MKQVLKRWKSTQIRSKMKSYREALENYFIEGRPLIEVAPGLKAFSLLSPPLGSPAAKRRLRIIAENMATPAALSAGGRQDPWGKRIPHTITAAITYNCQCDCLHCSAHHYREKMTQNDGALSFAELSSAIDQAVDLGTTCVVLTGGEPLLYPQLCDLVRSVDKKRSVCTMFTNGELFTPEVVRGLKDAGLFGVFFSLDYADPELHDQNRNRPGIFQKAINGIRLCQEAGILTGISTYATREKIESGQIDALMELGRELKVLEMFIFDVIPTGRLHEVHDCALDKEEITAIGNLRRIYNDKREYPRIIHQTMFMSMTYPCIAEGCPAGVVQVHLRANGDVSPCDFTPYSFGNVRLHPLSAIWQSMVSDSLYESHSPYCRMSSRDFREKLAARSAGAS